MIENDLINMIANNGFAIFVAVYVLTRLEKVMKQNTEVLKELKVLVNSRRCK